MVEDMPIPAPPRTPSPLSEDEREYGLGIEGASGGDRGSYSPTGSRHGSDLDSLSPESAGQGQDDNYLSPVFSNVFSPVSAMGSLASPITDLSTPSVQSRNVSGSSAISNMSNVSTISAMETSRNPFNFTTQQYTAGRVGNIKADIGKRRGHKYKHSSISHQIFLEPAPRAPLQLPTALPMPTRREVRNSMTSEQTLRLAWCLTHFAVAAYVQWSAHGSLAMTALSRLLFFDAAGAVACVLVDMMSNFEVWKRSTIKHPFGLERVDVLAGFGLAVFISFMGMDVLSHGIQHSLENKGGHIPHTTHSHTRVSPGTVDLAALLAIASTLVSAVLLKNHARIGRAMRFQFIAGWGKILGNPSHFMTLSCSALLLLLPLLSIKTYTWFDGVLAGVIAVMMIAFGVRLGTSLAAMLLMSYPAHGDSSSVKDVVSELEMDTSISAVDEARFWQVHYGLGMANLKLRYRANGYGDEVTRLRDRVASLVRNRLGGSYGSNGLKWEVSIQLAMEQD